MRISFPKNWSSKDWINRCSVAVAVLCFVFLFVKYLASYRDEVADIEECYESGLSVNLDGKVSEAELARLLTARGYFTDKADAALVSRTIADSLRAGHTPLSIYSFRTNSWKLPFSAIEQSGGEELKTKASHIIRRLGLESGMPMAVSDTMGLANGNGRIGVKVKAGDSVASGVTVCLWRHYFDSSLTATDSILAVALTNADGEVLFTGLDTAGSYSVLPVRRGFEYGSSRGTTGGTLGTTPRNATGFAGRFKKIFNKRYGDLQFTFEQSELRVAMFDDATLRDIRSDHAFTLRTPSMWRNSASHMAGWFVAMWIAFCFVLWLRRRGEAVYWPAAVMIGITGIGLLGMLSFTDPFTDVWYARDYLKGLAIGLALMAAMQFVDLKGFFAKRWFDPVGEKCERKGAGWFAVAMLLTLLLFTPLGHSVGGMAVNLKLGSLTFQPSEVAKYLIVIFFAAWFCRKADTLVGYSEEGNISLTRKKIRHVAGIFTALFCMLLVYLVLGDMGPGLVLLFSFIIIYSIVKSRTDVKRDFVSRALHSDIFLLVVGVLSFLLMLWIGSLLHVSAVMAVVWFAVWIVGWAISKRQLVETPVMANAVIAVFVFARDLPGSLGERFATRGEMCTNTWGNLGLDGAAMRPTSNSQVADGLWGLASGGFFGQGFANGSPNYIPAFHTDMVLSSLGEQMGWLGIAVAVMLLLALLHHTVAVGYRSRNQFAFFVCLGVAVVTAVQFTVIALGSNGVIPLTGVAVPLLSYGRVSMIMTLMAFGAVLSIEAHTFAPRSDNAVDQASLNLFRPYDAPVSVTRAVWFLLTLFIVAVIARPMLFTRNDTLIRPLFVTSKTGENILRYNPRIADVTRALKPGNIYDRNGLLLATSMVDSVDINAYKKCGVSTDEVKQTLAQRTRRYYPLGDRMLFMLGNLNSPFAPAYSEAWPAGYLAEQQHLSYLRGFDNMLYTDASHTIPCKVDILSRRLVADRYQPTVEHLTKGIALRDYSALLPFLRAGRNSRRIEKVNARKSRYIKPQDLHLTVDAQLQCSLQDKIASFCKEEIPPYGNKNLMRVSVVVVDACSGDLLASALYPQPCLDSLKAHVSEKTYNEGRFSKGQRAWTDRDLGLVSPTAPGSTAKVMTALAGLRKEGEKAEQQKFFIHTDERIEIPGDPVDWVTMREAIVKSSNCYFVNLLNYFNLYSTLDTIYAAVGANLNISKDKSMDNKAKYVTSYFLRHVPANKDKTELWNSIVCWQEYAGLAAYRSYMSRRSLAKPLYVKKMNDYFWASAWGQGTLAVTPLGMARVVSAVANGGVMPLTRYRLDEPVGDGIRLVEAKWATTMKSYMHEMAKTANGKPANAIHDPAVGGKTGTPEREFKSIKLNDGWFVFYVDDCTVKTGSKTERHPLAVAVRIERLPDQDMGSGVAMRMSRDAVLAVLADMGYHKTK